MRKMFITLLAVMSLVLAGLATANAAGPPEGHGPPTGGEEEGNNLSVPAIFVDGGEQVFSLTCPSGPTPPVDNPAVTTDDPRTGFELAGFYFLQKVHRWQAQCVTAGAVDVTVDWGDNLEGDALKAGTPIRVEVGLIDTDAVPMNGFVVEKLQPSLSDKASVYGTEATLVGDHYEATETEFPYTTTVFNHEGQEEVVTVGIRVFDPDATFTLENVDTGLWVVGPDPVLMGSEMNAKGAIVYGYNWGIGNQGVKYLPTAGVHVLTFTAPNVDLTEGGEVDHTATLTFMVQPNVKNNGKSAAAKANGR